MRVDVVLVAGKDDVESRVEQCCGLDDARFAKVCSGLRAKTDHVMTQDVARASM